MPEQVEGHLRGDRDRRGVEQFGHLGADEGGAEQRAGGGVDDQVRTAGGVVPQQRGAGGGVEAGLCGADPVTGCGGVGLNTIQFLRTFGAYPIIAVDLLDHKLEAAKKFGATHTINAAEEDPVKAVRDLTDGGVNKSFEALGNVKTSDQIIQATRPGGTATIIGGLGKVPFTISDGSFTMQEIRIAGVALRRPTDVIEVLNMVRDKRVEVALTYIYGVGRTRALATLKETGISGEIRVKDLTDDQLVALRDHIEGTYKVEGDLRREVQADIRRKVEIGSYQGLRHRRGLPVHGQRTKTNARTRKGPKRTVAGKKKAGKK